MNVIIHSNTLDATYMAISLSERLENSLLANKDQPEAWSNKLQAGFYLVAGQQDLKDQVMALYGYFERHIPETIEISLVPPTPEDELFLEKVAVVGRKALDRSLNVFSDSSLREIKEPVENEELLVHPEAIPGGESELREEETGRVEDEENSENRDDFSEENTTIDNPGEGDGNSPVEKEPDVQPFYEKDETPGEERGDEAAPSQSRRKRKWIWG